MEKDMSPSLETITVHTTYVYHLPTTANPSLLRFSLPSRIYVEVVFNESEERTASLYVMTVGRRNVFFKCSYLILSSKSE